MTQYTAAEFDNLIASELPWAAEQGIQTLSITAGAASLRLPFDTRSVRPGNTVAGPSIMGLADATMYAVVLSLIGEVKLAVTTSLNINFLRAAGANDLIANGSVIKQGKRLVIVEVTVTTGASEDPVAHATGTYSVPPS